MNADDLMGAGLREFTQDREFTSRLCKNCSFFDPEPDEELERVTQGECRRHAPRPTTGRDTERIVEWPKVGTHEWCGDFEANIV